MHRGIQGSKQNCLRISAALGGMFSSACILQSSSMQDNSRLRRCRPTSLPDHSRLHVTEVVKGVCVLKRENSSTTHGGTVTACVQDMVSVTKPCGRKNGTKALQRDSGELGISQAQPKAIYQPC